MKNFITAMLLHVSSGNMQVSSSSSTAGREGRSLSLRKVTARDLLLSQIRTASKQRLDMIDDEDDDDDDIVIQDKVTSKAVSSIGSVSEDSDSENDCENSEIKDSSEHMLGPQSSYSFEALERRTDHGKCKHRRTLSDNNSDINNNNNNNNNSKSSADDSSGFMRRKGRISSRPRSSSEQRCQSSTSTTPRPQSADRRKSSARRQSATTNTNSNANTSDEQEKNHTSRGSSTLVESKGSSSEVGGSRSGSLDRLRGGRRSSEILNPNVVSSEATMERRARTSRRSFSEIIITTNDGTDDSGRDLVKYNASEGDNNRGCCEASNGIRKRPSSSGGTKVSLRRSNSFDKPSSRRTRDSESSVSSSRSPPRETIKRSSSSGGTEDRDIISTNSFDRPMNGRRDRDSSISRSPRGIRPKALSRSPRGIQPKRPGVRIRATSPSTRTKSTNVRHRRHVSWDSVSMLDGWDDPSGDASSPTKSGEEERHTSTSSSDAAEEIGPDHRLEQDRTRRQASNRGPRDRLSQTSHGRSRGSRGDRLSQSSHNQPHRIRRDRFTSQSSHANLKTPAAAEDATIDDSAENEEPSSAPQENAPQENNNEDDTELSTPLTTPEQTYDTREQAPITTSRGKPDHMCVAETTRSYDESALHHKILSQSVAAQLGVAFLDPPRTSSFGPPLEAHAAYSTRHASNIEALHLSRPAATTSTVLNVQSLDPHSVKPIPLMKCRRRRDRLSQSSHDRSSGGHGGRISQSSQATPSRRRDRLSRSRSCATFKAIEEASAEDDTIDDSSENEDLGSSEAKNAPQEMTDDAELTAPSPSPEQTFKAKEHQAPTPSEEKAVGDAETKCYDEVDTHDELLSQSVAAKLGAPFDLSPAASFGLSLEAHSRQTFTRRPTSDLEALLSRPVATFSVLDAPSLAPPSVCCPHPVSQAKAVPQAKMVPQVKPEKKRKQLADLPTPDTNNKEPVAGGGHTSALDADAMPDMFFKTTNISKSKNKVKHLVGGLLKRSASRRGKYQFEPSMEDSSTSLDFLGDSLGGDVAPLRCSAVGQTLDSVSFRSLSKKKEVDMDTFNRFIQSSS
jgi:hypothetical protein